MDEFIEETNDVLQQATKTLRSLLPHLPSNSVVIFNVDNTLLERFALPPSERKGMNRPFRAPFPPVVHFYHQVQQMGIPIIILTARHEYRREETIENLAIAGIQGYDDLILRQEDENNLSHAEYKAKHRHLIATTRTIIGSVSNNWDDFEGGDTGIIIKIPNWPGG